VAAERLAPHLVVMDIVYNPLETRLLAAARARGCQTQDGVAMFVHQGAIQFELWTGRPAPLNLMRATVIEQLRRAENQHRNR
jgi:shikimate dehydrogenase